jgi:hypothetical protein
MRRFSERVRVCFIPINAPALSHEAFSTLDVARQPSTCPSDDFEVAKRKTVTIIAGLKTAGKP